MKYRSKIDIVFVCVLLIFIAVPVIAAILSVYFGSTLLLLVLAFATIDLALIIPMWVHTQYTFNKDHLLIESGIFVKVAVPYASIKRYGIAAGELAPSALAKKGIKIIFTDKQGNESTIYISPLYQGFFLDEMRKNTGLDAQNFPIPQSFKLSR